MQKTAIMTREISELVDIQTVNESSFKPELLHDIRFGTVFTDHMLVADFKNGQWQKPKIMPYGPLAYEPSAKVFHYGQAIFEGMKAFKDNVGNVFLFRPRKNFERMNKSAERLAMPLIPEEYFMEGIKQLVALDRQWIPEGEGASLYIRPVYIATDNEIAASPSQSYRFMVILSPAQAYYRGEVKVKFETRYSRACPGGTGYAKAAGNYAAQFMPTEKAKKEGYQQVIWTDAVTHELVEESGTMNVFFRINDTLLTAPVNDQILNGVTRDSIIQLAKDNRIPIEVRKITVDELVEAAKAGNLKEIFGSGTAATVLPIKGLGWKNEFYELQPPVDSYADRLKKMLMDIQYNRTADPYGWRVPVI